MIKDINDLLYNLYKNYYDMAYRRAYYILQNKALAEDAVHEAFIIVYYKIDQLKDAGRIVPWLMTIVKNCAIAQLKHGTSICQSMILVFRERRILEIYMT